MYYIIQYKYLIAIQKLKESMHDSQMKNKKHYSISGKEQLNDERSPLWIRPDDRYYKLLYSPYQVSCYHGNVTSWLRNTVIFSLSISIYLMKFIKVLLDAVYFIYIITCNGTYSNGWNSLVKEKYALKCSRSVFQCKSTLFRVFPHSVNYCVVMGLKKRINSGRIHSKNIWIQYSILYRSITGCSAHTKDRVTL